jgi:PAS domain S-box-containing protein
MNQDTDFHQASEESKTINTPALPQTERGKITAHELENPLLTAVNESETQIAADLAGMRRLYELQSKLADQNDLKTALSDVLAVACEFTGTDRGCVQLLSDDGERLEMFVWQGYTADSPFISFFRYEGLKTGCEVTRVQRQRLIIEETIGFPGLGGTEAGAAASADGIRASQSTPMTNGAGETIGVISTQFRQPHRSSDHELRLMDMLAWTAGQFLERHRADAANREFDARFRALVTASSDALYQMSADWSEMRQLQGGNFIADTEEARRDWLELYIHPDDQPKVLAAVNEAIRTKSIFELEHRVRLADGGIGWTFSRAIPVLDAGGEIVEWFGAASDVTARKQSEEKVRESEEKYRSLFNSIDEGFCTVEVLFDENERAIDFRFLDTNPAFGLQTGLADATGRTMLELKPNHESFWFDTFGNVALSGESVRFEAYAAALKRWFSVYAQRVGDLEDRQVAIVFFDINERKQAEEILRESEARLQKAIGIETVGVIFFDAEGNLTSCNDAFLEMSGFPREQIQSGETNWEDLTPPEWMARSKQAFAELQRKGRTTPYEKEYFRQDGSRFWGLFAASNINENESVEYIVNVSTRKQAEESLRQSQNHLTLAQEIGKMGSFEWNFKAGKFIVSEELDVLYGVNIGELEGNFDAWLNFVHPEDRKGVEQKMENFLSSGNLLNEYRIITPAGETRWISAIAKVFYDDAGKPERLVGVNMNITERKQAELGSIESEKRFRAIFDNAAIGIALVDLEGQVFLSNPALRQMLGYTEEEILSIPISEITHPEDIEKDLVFAEELFEGERDYYQLEKRYIKKNGDVMWGHLTGSAVNNEKGEILFGIGMIEDITVRKQLESQLRQAQKLESVGRLTGGIAHDFNNMLTAINGYSDLTLRKLETGNPLRGNIEEIKKAGERSAQLTHQLLAFSRQQILQPKILDLNETIHETSKMLQRLIGEDIELQLVLNSKISRIEVDPGQLTQVIMNLTVNARDALPDGGSITIQTDNVYLDEKFIQSHPSMQTGNYVMLSVSDTGTGMDEETQHQIFEPFFTTKREGEGTGLGLATVYGIVSQSGGYIWVESELGQGTTFLIYFPSVVEETKTEEAMDIDYNSHSGTETILVVEDEPMVRSLTRQILEECGYQVIEAGSGKEALEICEQSDCQIDLLMTDLVMPGMSGRELAEKLKTILPQLKVLFTSGYTDDAIIKHGISETKQNFIQKPFIFEGLSKKVRDVIDNVNL